MAAPDQLQLKRVVFYGRSLAEYELFFNLRVESLSGKRVLDCPAGASSFAAESRSHGVDVWSVDPVYAHAPADLRARAAEDLEHTLAEVSRIRHVYTWKFFPTWEAMRASRFETLELFLKDWQSSRWSGRYVAAGLPCLPFDDNAFDVVLSGHLLFIYRDYLPPGFQLAALRELVRVSRNEVRVFPVSLMNREPFPETEELLDTFAREGVQGQVEPSRHEFVTGWNKLLVLRKTQIQAGPGSRTC